MYDLIYKHRRSIDEMKQPGNSETLSLSLDVVLKELGYHYPFAENCSEQLWDRLREYPGINEVATGKQANVEGHDYLYSIARFGSIFHRRYLKYFDEYYSFIVDDIDSLYSRINARFTDEQSWLPLSDYINKQLPSRRGFNWWSSLSMHWENEDEIVDNALKCGIPIDWLVDKTLIFRLRITDQNKEFIKIPTIIDAFESPIFRARSFLENTFPSSGKSIELKNNLDINIYTREYLADLSGINSGMIDFFPIFLNTTELKNKHSQSLESHLLQELVNYYVTLAENHGRLAN